MKGLVHIYEGTGKGKSTAGVGLTIRCAGNGPEEKVEAKAAYTALFEKVKAAAVEQNARLLVMDEMLDLCNAELIDTAMVVDFLKNRPEQLEVVMTGRNPKPELVELADYITNMNAVKHPFEKGVPARKGIEM